ncbi:hypothetical protein CH263_08400 [Rhodococcus sp. 06-1059B-a]|nr:hypothetical protein [Rhodococcus sp. 06-1059B-a]OZD68909.1 hypothetical protein CH263_08400 [Rhodococcus sp. 06-1059B-a]
MPTIEVLHQRELFDVLLNDAQVVGGYDAAGRLTPASARLVAILWSPAIGTLHDLAKTRALAFSGPHPRPLFLHEDDWECLASNHEERDWLVMEMAISALPKFVKAVIDENSWDSARSALLTYFVNGCLLYKFEVLNKWSKQRRAARKFALNVSTEGLASIDIDLSDDPHASIEARKLMRRATPAVRPILWAIAMGETIASAARDMGISEGAARERLFRFRRGVVVRMVSEGDIEAPPGSAIAEYLSVHSWNEDEGPYAASKVPDLDDDFAADDFDEAAFLDSADLETRYWSAGTIFNSEGPF